MKKTLSALALIISLAGNAQEPSLNLFAAAKEKAAKENKNILLYFSGSDWCAPCIKFKRNFISSPEFKLLSDDKLVVYNADFPRLKAHLLAAEKKTDNENLAETYNKQGQFPLILLLDANGKILKKWKGYPEGTLQEFITAIQKI